MDSVFSETLPVNPKFDLLDPKISPPLGKVDGRPSDEKGSIDGISVAGDGDPLLVCTKLVSVEDGGVDSGGFISGSSKSTVSKPSFRDMVWSNLEATGKVMAIPELDVVIGDGDYGHTVEVCKKNGSDLKSANMTEIVDMTIFDLEEHFGPWMEVTNRKGRRIDKEKEGECRLTENKVNYGVSMEKMRGVGGHRSEKGRPTAFILRIQFASSSPPTNGIRVVDKGGNSPSVERQLGKEVVGTGAKKGDVVQTVTRSPSEVSPVFAKKNIASKVISEMEGAGLNNPMVGDVASKEVVVSAAVTLPTLNHKAV
ncbi:hypothetical protein V6N13_029002 [Hibiscus sabdariffa]